MTRCEMNRLMTTSESRARRWADAEDSKVSARFGSGSSRRCGDRESTVGENLPG